ncbi:MAG TPA: GNAT family N-acetyltransferase [Cytophagaceae bacterium]|nr:GNAT family N-acetyltransferase [Cytophagaceae bacterium]
MDLSDFDFIKLSPGTNLENFDCDEDEITGFLKEDAKNYQHQRLANTYLFLKDDKIVAYFSISNDCLVDRGEEKGFTKTIFNRLHRKESIPNDKRIKQYPSVKVGRLGVNKKYHGTGIAYQLMDFIKGICILDHKPACPAIKFLILDALNKERQIKYYQKNGFVFLLDNDSEEENRIMYFNLERLI